MIPILKEIIESYREISHEKSLPISKNKTRSCRFIGKITEKFMIQYPESDNYKVFSREIDKDEDFQLSEFLFDVHVCKFGITKSTGKKVDLKFIEESFIVIESEFKEDNDRNLVIDFSKLVCSNARYKIMISPYKKNKNKYLEMYKPLSNNITNELYCIFIPHPNIWDKNVKFEIYQFVKGTWNIMEHQ